MLNPFLCVDFADDLIVSDDDPSRQQAYFPLEFAHDTGGMMHSVATLTRCLQECLDVTIIAPTDSSYLDAYTNAGVGVEMVCDSEIWELRFSIRSLLNLFKLRRRMGRIINPASTVVCNNISSAIFCTFPFRLRCRKLIYVVRGGTFRGKMKHAYRHVAKRSDAIVFTSKSHKDAFLEVVAYPASKATVIGNPIVCPDVVAIPEQFNTISIIGYPSQLKNQELGLKAIKIARDLGKVFQLNLIGAAKSQSDILYLAYLKDLTKQFGLEHQVRFFEFISDKNLLFSLSDIVLSTSSNEGFGRTLAEGMAYGRLSIAMEEAGGPREIILNGKTGYLLSHAEPSLLAHLLIEVCSNVEQSKAIVRCGRDYVKSNFAPRSIAEMFQKVIADTE